MMAITPSIPIPVPGGHYNNNNNNPHSTIMSAAMSLTCLSLSTSPKFSPPPSLRRSNTMPARFSLDSSPKVRRRTATSSPSTTDTKKPPLPPSVTPPRHNRPLSCPNILPNKMESPASPSPVTPTSALSVAEASESPSTSRPRSILRPSLSQRPLVSPKKSLAFADDIERICLFVKTESPSTVADGERFHIPDCGDLDLGTVSSAITMSSTWSIKTKNIPVVCTFGSRTVVLDNVYLNHKNQLRFVTLVRNLAFEKQVTIRYTLDNWATIHDLKCEFEAIVTPTMGGYLGVDRFVGHMNLNTELGFDIIESKLQFAVCFNAAGAEYWDNHSGANYQVEFELLSLARLRSASSTKRRVGLSGDMASQMPRRALGHPVGRAATVPAPKARPYTSIAFSSFRQNNVTFQTISPDDSASFLQTPRAVSLSARSSSLSSPWAPTSGFFGSSGTTTLSYVRELESPSPPLSPDVSRRNRSSPQGFDSSPLSSRATSSPITIKSASTSSLYGSPDVMGSPISCSPPCRA